MLRQHFKLSITTEEMEMRLPRYNIAPSQPLLAVVASASPESGSLQRRATYFRWGLVPAWRKVFQGGWINARAETAAEKPAFRAALRRRRCLIPADGFYEWTGSGKPRQPYWIHLREKTPSGWRKQPVFAFAGIWERWQGSEGTVVETCAILNTTANRLMQVLHERMPVILSEQDYECWLDPQIQDPQVLLPLLRPYPCAAMVAYPVSIHVNFPHHEDPACQEPVGDPILLPAP